MVANYPCLVVDHVISHKHCVQSLIHNFKKIHIKSHFQQKTMKRQALEEIKLVLQQGALGKLMNVLEPFLTLYNSFIDIIHSTKEGWRLLTEGYVTRNERF